MHLIQGEQGGDEIRATRRRRVYQLKENITKTFITSMRIIQSSGPQFMHKTARSQDAANELVGVTWFASE